MRLSPSNTRSKTSTNSNGSRSVNSRISGIVAILNKTLRLHSDVVEHGIDDCETVVSYFPFFPLASQLSSNGVTIQSPKSSTLFAFNRESIDCHRYGRGLLRRPEVVRAIVFGGTCVFKALLLFFFFDTPKFNPIAIMDKRFWAVVKSRQTLINPAVQPSRGPVLWMALLKAAMTAVWTVLVTQIVT